MSGKWTAAAVAFATVAAGTPASARIARLTVTAPGLETQRVPDRYAFCRADGHGRATPGDNRSPGLSWSAGPAGTRSYAIVMTDADVPASGSLVNRADRTIPVAAPRSTFFHWILVDLAAGMRSLPEANDSAGVTPRGKPLRRAEPGRRGINDYTGFLKDDPAMRGTYAGYDGPCPPWNDLRVHHYTLAVYALNVPTLDVPAGFNGRALGRALAGRVLARGAVTRTYTTRR